MVEEGVLGRWAAATAAIRARTCPVDDQTEARPQPTKAGERHPPVTRRDTERPAGPEAVPQAAPVPAAEGAIERDGAPGRTRSATRRRLPTRASARPPARHGGHRGAPSSKEVSTWRTIASPRPYQASPMRPAIRDPDSGTGSPPGPRPAREPDGRKLGRHQAGKEAGPTSSPPAPQEGPPRARATRRPRRRGTPARRASGSHSRLAVGRASAGSPRRSPCSRSAGGASAGIRAPAGGTVPAARPGGAPRSGHPAVASARPSGLAGRRRPLIRTWPGRPGRAAEESLGRDGGSGRTGPSTWPARRIAPGTRSP